jgi:hypothetical protein
MSHTPEPRLFRAALTCTVCSRQAIALGRLLFVGSATRLSCRHCRAALSMHIPVPVHVLSAVAQALVPALVTLYALMWYGSFKSITELVTVGVLVLLLMKLLCAGIEACFWRLQPAA